MKMPTFEQAQAEFERVDAEAKKHIKLREHLRKVRDALCPHTVMVSKKYYFPGSYYDTAYTDYWYECSCCGFKTEKKNEQHSWYG